MRNYLLFFLLLNNICLFGQDISNFIHLDQFGYLPEAPKVAVLSNPQTGYNANESYQAPATIEVRNTSTDEVFMTISPQIWNNGSVHSSSGDQGWWVDFSSLEEPGTYYLYDAANNEQSAIFEVSSTVYEEVLQAAGRMFFYNRCNFAKLSPFADPAWSDELDFTNNLQDANCRYVYDPNNPALEKDLTGGWYDAGDYNKYVTFTETTLHHLLWAFRENPLAFSDAWNIPESGNGLPDILDEVKWELDWLLKMNNPDGSTHIKMGSISYDENVAAPPSENIDQRYYGPTCTSASITVASIFAHAAQVYKDFPAYVDFAQTLRNRAIAAFDYCIQDIQNGTAQTDCDDGTILSGDADRDEDTQRKSALIAAIHLFELTGDPLYNDYVDNFWVDATPILDNYFTAYDFPLTDALLLYTTLPDAYGDVIDVITSSIETAVSNNWEAFYGFNDLDLYRAFMPDYSYHWGSSQAKADYANLNNVLLQYDIPSGLNIAQKVSEQLHYFHGCNPNGLVYLSNMYDLGGERCVNEIYHTWFADGTIWDNALDSQYGPPPGYVTGGPNASFSVANLSPPANQPPQKSYLDFNTNWPDNSWEISEPAIYYQASYIRLLANFTNLSAPQSTNQVNALYAEKVLFPNPTSGKVFLSSNAPATVQVFDIYGRLILEERVTTNSFDLTPFKNGIFFVQIKQESGGMSEILKVIKQ